jgi:hypothetical protein
MPMKARVGSNCSYWADDANLSTSAALCSSPRCGASRLMSVVNAVRGTHDLREEKKSVDHALDIGRNLSFPPRHLSISAKGARPVFHGILNALLRPFRHMFVVSRYRDMMYGISHYNSRSEAELEHKTTYIASRVHSPCCRRMCSQRSAKLP